MGRPKAWVYFSREFVEDAEQVGDECGRHDSLLQEIDECLRIGVNSTLPLLCVAFARQSNIAVMASGLAD
jgi:hypothetical protein